MKPFKENAILLLVANPVDVLTYFAQKLSGLPRNQVLGTGTFLDSARLRGYLAEKVGVAASSIDAFVLGEHGDSQFVAWSLATIGGIPLSRAFPIDSLDLPGLAKATREKAASIIEHKGATAFGIGGVTASICKSILFDHRNIRPISHFVDHLDCCLSLPVVLGREGVVRTIPCPFDDVEKKDLEESARSLRKVIKSVETVES
jgi:L-lactate dehydrogenase